MNTKRTFLILESRKALCLPKGEYLKDDIPFQPLPDAEIAWVEFDGDKEVRPFKLLFSSETDSQDVVMDPKSKTIFVGKKIYHLYSISPIHHGDERFFSAIVKKNPPQDGKIRVF